jgi:hypothetical protein
VRRSRRSSSSREPSRSRCSRALQRAGRLRPRASALTGVLLAIGCSFDGRQAAPPVALAAGGQPVAAPSASAAHGGVTTRILIRRPVILRVVTRPVWASAASRAGSANTLATPGLGLVPPPCLTVSTPRNGRGPGYRSSDRVPRWTNFPWLIWSAAPRLGPVGGGIFLLRGEHDFVPDDRDGARSRGLPADPLRELPSGEDRSDRLRHVAAQLRVGQPGEEVRLIRGRRRQMTVASKPRLVQRNRAAWLQHRGAQREGQQ